MSHGEKTIEIELPDDVLRKLSALARERNKHGRLRGSEDKTFRKWTREDIARSAVLCDLANKGQHARRS